MSTNKNNLPVLRQGGFIQVIIAVVIALLLMKYFGITVTTVLNWIKAFADWFKVYFQTILK